MEIQVVKNEKNVEVIHVYGNKKGISKLSADENSSVKVGKISNKVLKRIGGFDTFVRRLNRMYSNFNHTVTTPAPVAEVAPAPVAEVAPVSEQS